MPSLTPDLERVLERSLALATERGHDCATLEHLLLALLSDPDALGLLKDANIASLESALNRALDAQPRVDPVDAAKPHPTAGFQRVIQRAVLYCESAGRPVISGADVIASIHAERTSDAARLLEAENVTLETAQKYLFGASARMSAPLHSPAPPDLDPIELLQRQLAIAMYRIERLEEQVRDLLRK
jgi:ATP-dependent Clp protease ATP-binding subunit ClpA